MLNKKIRNDIERERERWEQELLKPAQSSLRKPEFITSNGIPIDMIYDPLTLGDFDYLRDLGYPGQYPYTRGASPAMYRSELCGISQYSGFGTAEETNQRFKYLLSQGQTGFAIAVDLPTQLGYDPDHELAKGEVGKVGVVLSSMREVEKLFDGIPLNKVRQIYAVVNANACIVGAMVIAYCEKTGIDPNSFAMSFQNDVLKEYIARGNYIFPPKSGVKARNIPRWIPIYFCGAHIRGAGGNAVQEIGYCFANAIAQIEEVASRGLKVEDFVPKCSSMFNTTLELLEEVAKLRAARRLWSRLMKERFGVENPMPLNIHGYGSCYSLTAQQPLNNIARVAVEAIACLLSGVSSMSTPSFDEAYSIPTEEAVRTSLRVMQIVAHETGLTDYVDPLAGSYVVESLTNELEKKFRETIAKIDELGGAVAAIEQDYMQRQISEGAFKVQRDIESGAKCVVGVNKFRMEGEKIAIPVFEVNEEAEKNAVEAVKAVRRGRDNRAVSQALAVLKQQAKAGKNIMPAAIEASKVYATMQEMCDVLRDIHGTYSETGVGGVLKGC